MLAIYGRDNCVFCERAKYLLEEKVIPYQYFKIGDDVSKEWFMKQYPERKTVPTIVLNDKMIGGYEDLCKVIDKLEFHDYPKEFEKFGFQSGVLLQE